tara:strand:+ start:682 stop:819 length:138 start_codon:yes stop_codon:yes gene_type:complete
MNFNNHIKEYFSGIKDLSEIINKKDIEKLVKALAQIKKKMVEFFF